MEVENTTTSPSKSRTSRDRGRHVGGSMAELIRQQREEADKQRKLREATYNAGFLNLRSNSGRGHPEKEEDKKSDGGEM